MSEMVAPPNTEPRASMWVTYTVKYGGQRDETTSFYNIAFYSTEIVALRHVNLHGGKAIQVYSGEKLEDAIKRVHKVL